MDFGIEKGKAFKKEKYMMYLDKKEYSYSDAKTDRDLIYAREDSNSSFNPKNQQNFKVEEKNPLKKIYSKEKSTPTKNFEYNLIDNDDSIPANQIKYNSFGYQGTIPKELKFNHSKEIIKVENNTLDRLSSIRSKPNWVFINIFLKMLKKMLLLNINVEVADVFKY